MKLKKLNSTAKSRYKIFDRWICKTKCQTQANEKLYGKGVCYKQTAISWFINSRLGKNITHETAKNKWVDVSTSHPVADMENELNLIEFTTSNVAKIVDISYGTA